MYGKLWLYYCNKANAYFQDLLEGPDRVEQLVQLASRERSVHRAPPVPLELLDLPARQDFLVQLDLPGHLEIRVHLVHEGLMDFLDNGVK